MKDFLKDRRKAAQVQRIEILLAGKVNIPRLICQRSVLTDLGEAGQTIAEVSTNELTSNEQVIPLAVKAVAAPQRFRIPFKNVGEHEIEVEFSFVRNSQAVN